MYAITSESSSSVIPAGSVSARRSALACENADSQSVIAHSSRIAETIFSSHLPNRHNMLGCPVLNLEAAPWGAR